MTDPGWPPPTAPEGEWLQTAPSTPQWYVPPAPEPVERDYPWFWRQPTVAPWRPILAVVLGVVGFFVVSLVFSGIGMAVDAALNPGGFQAVVTELLSGEVSRVMFVANSVSLGFLIPLALLLQLLSRQRPGFLSSVVGRIRWGWMWTCFAVAMTATLGYLVFGVLVDGWDSLGLAVRPGWAWLLVAILVVTPFQSAGEEYLVRGILNRAVAALLPWRVPAMVLGAVVSSWVFMLLHGAGDPWLQIMYFTMGLMFCYLTWRTGGLEAAVALHVANNLVGLGLVPFQEWGGIFDRQAGVASPVALLQLVFLGAAVVAIEWLARRRGVACTGVPVERRRAVR